MNTSNASPMHTYAQPFVSQRPGSILWFARHEAMLSWRLWLSIMAGGRRGKDRIAKIGLIVFIVAMHGLAYILLEPILTNADFKQNVQVLVAITGFLLLSFFMMLSQTLESVTRAFYTRDDLDLILSSPIAPGRLFAVRMGAIAFSSAGMTVLLAAPAINIAALLNDPSWFAAYIVVFGLSALATGLAILTTLGLFRTVGAKRTRFVAQIIAAVVGAGFLIGIQVAAILSLGSTAKFSLLSSNLILDAAPAVESWFWMPADAVMGNLGAAVLVFAAGLAGLLFVIRATADNFGKHVLNAAGLTVQHKTNIKNRQLFRTTSRRQSLRIKEWTLLGRDPWLVSQTLMQILYLIPPALILWTKYGSDTNAHVILAPVLVMAFGQLAGGLAWLAISGEDAPDLIATAPITRPAITGAKIESIMALLGVLALPLLLALSFFSVKGAVITALGIATAATSAIAIQLWFRTPSRRSSFRRRQTASRAATFSEAFSSIAWAGTTGLAAAGSGFAIVMGVFAVMVLLLAFWLSPDEKPIA